MMKILFFNPEQYVHFENEPSNVQLRLPILNCGLDIAHRDHVYQRDLKAHGRAEMDRRALAAVAEFRPDVVVYSATWEHENLSPGVLKAIRDGGTPVVAMLWDSWIEPTTAEAELLAGSTVLVVGDSLHTYLRCRMAGQRLSPRTSVVFFGGQVFTDLIRPLPGEPKEFDVTLLGSNEGERAHLVVFLEEELSRRGLRFNKAGGLVDSRKGAFKLTDDWVSWDDYVRIINRSRLCLNSPTDPTRVQIKGKIFDYMACGVACLTDANPQVRRFIPDGAVALFDGAADCLAQILRLLDDEAERERIAAAGHGWLRRTFDYKAFWRGVLQAALGDGHALPEPPGLADACGAFETADSALLRANLALAGHAAFLALAGTTPHRLPVAWLGRDGRHHLLGLEDGRAVATNRMPVDLLAVAGEIHAAFSGGPMIPLPTGVVRHGAGGLVIAAGESLADVRRLLAEDPAVRQPPL
ncbi:glycosyltransferase family protein [Azospirillum sp. sgz302134]